MRNACGWGEALTLCKQALEQAEPWRPQPRAPLRWARPEDLPALVALLADDELGARRENPAQLQPYAKAWAAIARDPRHGVLVLEQEGELRGMLQFSELPGLSQCGQWRAQIESVRVARAHRSQGLGRQLVLEALRLAAAQGCGLAQLTTDTRRPAAQRFYERLGFVASHAGMKQMLAADRATARSA
ncbi:GNAT family N-acetyltransferase [Inhella sp. 1Y17]|uniref:GNAT family N-acetyltransferase n=2 Tax=Inhella proteolytica TaxID=2795029 RepID=A0A931NIB9_9BURK|nr:GNAT family N-acetyltransferase [Inhella proteolytica]